MDNDEEEMTRIEEEMTKVEDEMTQVEKPTGHVEDLMGQVEGPISLVEEPMPQVEEPMPRVEEPMAMEEDIIAKEDESSLKAVEQVGQDPKPRNKEPSLQFGFYNDESFIKKVALETNSTIYKTALYDDADDNNRYNMSECEEIEEVIPSHLSEHNYTFPQE